MLKEKVVILTLKEKIVFLVAPLFETEVDFSVFEKKNISFK